MGDYTSATMAGVPFIFASYGFGQVAEGMIATVDSIGQLKDIL